ncbi:MAG: translation initiation factor IF-2 [Butyrivibrio sp.]|nr:translation initiation factor IF-2 [Acetatifactor muris]MCM1561300.1 translation initiation factor IF-2 [Butyrivibrio sp.]
MAKIRIHELAKELDKQSKEIQSFLQGQGIEAKSASSSVEEDVAETVRKAFRRNEAKPAAPSEKPVKEEKAPPKAASNEREAVSKASVQEKASQEKAAQEKPAQEKAVSETPKKKKTIIFVNNSQNSKMPGQQRYGQGGSAGRPQGQGGQKRPQAEKAGYGDRRNAGPVHTPIKPLTPPSPAPSVQMVPSRPQPKAKPEAEKLHQPPEVKAAPAAKPAVQTEIVQVQSRDNRPERSERRQEDRAPRDSNRVQDGRGQGSRGQDNRYQGARDNRGQSGSRGDRADRGQFQSRGGNGNGGSREDRGSGYPRSGRPGGNNGQSGNRGSGFGQGGNRSFNGAQRDNSGYGRGNGGQGAGFRDRGQNKGFAGEAPAKDMEKRRDDEKRRASNIEKDKRSRRDHIYEEEEALKNRPGRFIKPEKKKEEAAEEVIKVITLPEMITIKELAEKMKLQPAAIVKKLFLEGKIVTVNQEVSYEDAENIAMEYDVLCEKEVKVDVIEELLKEDEEEEGTLVERPPVVCVMGHVDHGKTSLLDAIRQTNVTDREAGGITQHIGAYTVNIKGRKITFLDTPGHEAFTAMRMRGANSTDIAILVVAADDGVMPQTIEAINHAKAAGIEIIVAVNKIDKPSANIERVKQELTEYELIATDWGGSTEFVPVSAKSGEGIENLLETILLTADILELKANPSRRARGLVIEAELDKGRGPVATVLVQKGTLHMGDFISAGACHGKVRAMIDDKGRRVKEADPSTPVEILGLSDVPSAGEVFLAHDNDKTAKTYADTYLAQNKERKLEETRSKMSLDDLFSQIKEGNLKELDLIVKADVQGSVEAVKQSLMKLSNEEIVVKCIHGGVGAINESDVTLASASNAIIIGFNVRPDATAKATAEREGVDVRLYKVIYQAIEDIEAAMKGMLDPVFEEKVIGHAEIRQVFKASQIGNIAGSYVKDGMFQRGCKIRITRGGEQIYEGALASLKRFKDDVKEVKEGFECGLVFEGFDQIQELDMVEAYIMVEVPR